MEGLPAGTTLMLVAVMPEGHMLVEVEGGPQPKEAKCFGDRMAVFWPIYSNGRTRICWRLARADATLLAQRCELVNERSPQRLDAFEDLGETTIVQFGQWEAVRPPPSSSAPAEAAAQNEACELRPGRDNIQ
jgi:hypothetical protein